MRDDYYGIKEQRRAVADLVRRVSEPGPERPLVAAAAMLAARFARAAAAARVAGPVEPPGPSAWHSPTRRELRASGRAPATMAR